MTHSNTPIVLVVCNDYGELAFALYLLANQSFARNTTLMLPPRLYAQNADVLPGRTLVYESLEDIQQHVGSSTPGILGLFSGYLLPIHRLCNVDALGSFLQSARSQGWKCFTSDPFLGLLEDVEPGELVKLKTPKISMLWSPFAVIKKTRLAAEAQVAESKVVLTQMHRMLDGMLHVYPVGDSPTPMDPRFAKRLHFHNPAIFLQPEDDGFTERPAASQNKQRWLFVLGDQDYAVQEEQYGHSIRGISRKFLEVLLLKLHETLEAGRLPTLVAPAKVVDAVREHSPVADTMELLPHCNYSDFQSLLGDAEYTFYWNAVSFSCILRTLTDKPWFTFDDGHLLRGMNNDYAKRISDWFYRGDAPPRLSIKATLTRDALQQATMQYLKPAWRIRQGLLASSDPDSLFSALEQSIAIQDALEIVQRLCDVVSANALDGSFIVDTALLTYPKGGIKSAVGLLLERGIGDQAELARLAAPTLAFFQPGIGAFKRAIDSPGPNSKPWRVAVEAEISAINQMLRT